MLKEILLTGTEINQIIPDLSRLRIEVFRDFPYLYEGTMEYEKQYLKRYAENANAMVFALYDGSTMIGATTAIPLADEDQTIKAALKLQGLILENYFYFGESMLLREYRGQGLGHLFFDKREKYALGFSGIKTTCFCSVERPENHPLRPADYRPNDIFWQKRGYTKQSDLQCQMSWQDIDQADESIKTLTFWTKTWR